ncbi:MAG: T9SS type A sorting domain-containing protein [Saprospiraceae bacterium]
MKNSTLILLLLALPLLANAQNPYKFTRPYGAIQTDINRGYKIIPTQDGNFVVAGEWNGNGYLMKLNCKGDSIERKTYTAVVGGNSTITDVLELPNGDLLVAGHCDHCVEGDTTGKVLLFMTDAGLNYKPTVGVKKFLPPVTGPLMTTGQALPETKLAVANDGYYVLSITQCLSDSSPSFSCWNAEDSYVSKLDHTLNIQWQKLLNYKNEFIFHTENAPQIRVGLNSIYVSRWGNHILGGFLGQQDSSVVQKTDLNGNPLISKAFKGRILHTALNPAGTVLTCVGEIDTVAWLMNLDANTLNVLNSSFMTETNRTQAVAVQYSSNGHLLVGSKHWRQFSVQSRTLRMQSDFAVLSVDTIPNPDNITNMSITSLWPTNADGTRFVSCGIRGFYNRTFFHALSDCMPFNFSVANINPVTCNGFSNGSVTLLVIGGYGPFQYRSDNGSWQNSNTFNNLGSGTYSYHARDGNGNKLSLDATITEPPALTVAASVNMNVITVTASGGTAPMEFSLNGQDFQAGNVFSGLDDGSYTVTVKDAKGCTATQTVTVIFVDTKTPEWLTAFKLFPNPNRGVFWVEMNCKQLGELEFAFFNASGQMVYSEIIIPQTNAFVQHVDLGNKGPGVYWLRIRSGAESWMHKIVITP